MHEMELCDSKNRSELRNQTLNGTLNVTTILIKKPNVLFVLCPVIKIPCEAYLATINNNNINIRDTLSVKKLA